MNNNTPHIAVIKQPPKNTAPGKQTSPKLTAAAFIAFILLTAATCLLYSIKGYTVYQPVILAVFFALFFSVIPVDMLIRYSWVLYVFFISSAVLGLAFGSVKGEYILIGNTFAFNLPALSSMMFLPITYLIIRYKNYSWKRLCVIYIAAGVPGMLLLLCRFDTSLSSSLVYWITILLMMMKASREKRLKINQFVLLLTVEFIVGLSAAVFLLSNEFALNRLIEFVEYDTQNIPQLIWQEKMALAGEILRSAPLFSGFDAVPDAAARFSDEQGFGLILLLIKHGWAAGLCLLLGNAILCITGFIMSSRIKKSYPKYLTYSIAVYFSARTVLSLLQITALIPFDNICFPFAGGLSSNIFDTALFGLLVCFYVRRDRIRIQFRTDEDYDAVQDTLAFFRTELEHEYRRTPRVDTEHRKVLEKTIRQIEIDEDKQSAGQLPREEIAKKYIHYSNVSAGKNIRKKNLVFISYNHNDVDCARRLSKRIEAQGVRCWYYTRDNKTGSYGGEITRKIRDEAKLFILIISGDSVKSQEVLNEVILACAQRPKGLIILPIKIEDVEYSDDLEYHLAGLTWNTAFNSQALDRFADLAVRTYRSGSGQNKNNP